MGHKIEKKMTYTKRKIIEDTLILQTPFLPQSVTIQQRGWHIMHNIDCVPICPNISCNNYLKFQKDNTYSKYCSRKCVANSPETLQKRKNSVIKTYGSEQAYKEYKASILKKISNEKYGVDNIFQADEIKEKIKQTVMEKYGVEHSSQSKIVKDNISNTMIERYGVEHALQSKEFRDKFNNTMIERYEVGHALQSEEILSKIKQNNNKQFDRDHHSQIHMSSDTLKKLNNKEWLIAKHHDEEFTIDAISNILNIDKTTVSRYLQEHSIEIKRHASSFPEHEITEFLNSYEVKTISNSRNIINPYELDIYLPDYNLAIEYCDLYWHSDINKPKNYHKIKYEQCKLKNIRLLTIFENEWLKNKDLVKRKILNIINKENNDRIFARKCKIVNVLQKNKGKFFDQYHIQGDGPSSINYGLEYNGELIAVMGFIQSKEYFILNRYATSRIVAGGFTKLLTHFEKEYNKPKIITFADLRWSEGELYKNSGFKIDKILKPDYYWCKDKTLWHKFNFRHSRMKNKLNKYDSNISEADNMTNDGYYKIWDCGKIRFYK